MQIKHIMYREPDGGNTLFLEFNDIQAKILDYGSNEFQIICPALYDKIDEPVTPGVEYWGTAFVYAEPITAAHLLWDVWSNT